MRLGDKKSLLSVRVSDDFYDWLSTRSELSGLSVSDYVRFILDDFRRAVEISEAIKKYQADFCNGDEPSNKHD